MGLEQVVLDREQVDRHPDPGAVGVVRGQRGEDREVFGVGGLVGARLGDRSAEPVAIGSRRIRASRR